MEIKALLFDLDGTLTNTSNIHKHSLFKVLNIDNTDNLSGLNTKQILSKLNLSHKLEEITLLKNNYFKEEIKKLKLNDFNYLQQLKSFYKLGLITNSSKDSTEIILNHFNLNYFDIIVTSSDVFYNKPNPEPYLLGLHKLNLSPYEVIVFEDTTIGFNSAYTAGIKNIIMTSHNEIESTIYDLKLLR